MPVHSPRELLVVSVHHCRLLAAIAMREWGAREACSHTALLNHLCDPRSESGEELSHWRFACTQVSLPYVFLYSLHIVAVKRKDTLVNLIREGSATKQQGCLPANASAECQACVSPPRSSLLPRPVCQRSPRYEFGGRRALALLSETSYRHASLLICRGWLKLRRLQYLVAGSLSRTLCALHTRGCQRQPCKDPTEQEPAVLQLLRLKWGRPDVPSLMC